MSIESFDNDLSPNATLQKLVKARPLVTGNEKILVLGASGQVAQFLVPKLQEFYPDNLILADLKANESKKILAIDVTDEESLKRFLHPNTDVKIVINLAALLSGAAEQYPDLAHKINIEAPRNIMRLAQESGVRKIFTPSSIAVLGPDARKTAEANHMDPHGEQGFGARMDATVLPVGNYGNAKKQLEQNSAAINERGDMLAMCLRFGGVLTCQKHPSNGTTEEIDKMVAAAAKYKACCDLKLPVESPFYHPAIPPDSTFALLDGRTVATEALRFLHADPKSIQSDAHHYAMAEYSASVGQAAKILHQFVPGFQIVFSEARYDPIKEGFAQSWPTHFDVSDSVKDWGFRQHYTLGRSISDHFNRLVDEFKAELAAENNLPAPKSNPSMHRQIYKPPKPVLGK